MNTLWRCLGVMAMGLVCAAQALACGVCVEDKMAVTYDHEVVQKAAAQHKVVVFCDVNGRVPADRLRKAAAQVAGIDITTVRTSVEPAAVSFALDTKIQELAAAIAQMEKILGPPVSLRLIKVLTPSPSSP